MNRTLDRNPNESQLICGTSGRSGTTQRRRGPPRVGGPTAAEAARAGALTPTGSPNSPGRLSPAPRRPGGTPAPLVERLGTLSLRGPPRASPRRQRKPPRAMWFQIRIRTVRGFRPANTVRLSLMRSESPSWDLDNGDGTAARISDGGLLAARMRPAIRGRQRGGRPGGPPLRVTCSEIRLNPAEQPSGRSRERSSRVGRRSMELRSPAP